MCHLITKHKLNGPLEMFTERFLFSIALGYATILIMLSGCDNYIVHMSMLNRRLSNYFTHHSEFNMVRH